MTVETISSAPTASEAPPPAMAQRATTPHGTLLCVSCRFSSTCMYRAQSGGNVLYCEEFESAETPQPRTLMKRRSLEAEMHSGVQDIGAIQGLCINCIDREHCTLGPREGGVWHCEEYR